MWQQVLANAEEILAVLTQSFYESFLGCCNPQGSGRFFFILSLFTAEKP